MAADASIYSLVKPQPSPIEQYGQALNLKALMGQGRLQDLQTTNAEQDLSERQAVNDVFKNAPQGSTLESLLPDLMKASSKTGIQYQKTALEQKKLGNDIAEGELKVQAAKAKDARDGLAGVSDQASYDAWRQTGAQKGYQVAKDAPAMFDPKWQQQHVMTADQFIASREHQLNRDVTQTGQAETARHNKVVELHGSLTSTETARHNKALEGDPETIEGTAQAISKGQLAPLSGFALQRPMSQKIMERVIQINPDFDPTQFATRQKSEKDFATGKQGQAVKSFNVAISHLGTLDQAADALNNGNMRLFNKFGNAYASQTGGTAPTDFNAVKKIVADELVKAIVGSGGGVSDREEAAKTIDAANSPAQLKGVIGKYKELMRGQLDGLRTQYKATTGKDDFDKKFLSEAAQSVVHDSQAASPGKAGPGKLVPTKGAVQDGFRFKGGDPSKQESWEKV